MRNHAYRARTILDAPISFYGTSAESAVEAFVRWYVRTYLPTQYGAPSDAQTPSRRVIRRVIQSCVSIDRSDDEGQTFHPYNREDRETWLSMLEAD